MKRIWLIIILLISFVSIQRAISHAGLRFGIPGAVKNKVKELDEKVKEKKEEEEEVVTPQPPEEEEPGGFWEIETVAKGQFEDISLALDGSNNPHISYVDVGEFGSSLKYAKFDGVSWSTQTVDSTVHVDDGTSLALDDSGNPHIAYFDNTNNDLRYAHFDGTSWSFYFFGFWRPMGYYPSLALDSSGNPHITFSHSFWPGPLFYYTRFDGHSWFTTGVGMNTITESATFNSLALDGSDNPYVAYVANYNPDYNPDYGYSLKYAKFDGVSWSIQTVVSSNDGLVRPFLALDDPGNPHIAYLDMDADWPSDYNLKYAKFDGVSWSIQTVVSSNDVLWGPSLALDDSGNPHIAYSIREYVKYAHFDGTSWSIQTVEFQGEGYRVGEYPSITLDSNNRPHISYYNYTEGALKYARWKE